MKLWVLADSLTSYTYNFDVYLRKNERSAFGLAYHVMKLCFPLLGKGYKLFVDNFYTYVQLWVREGNLDFIQWKDKTVNVLTIMHKFVTDSGFCERRVKVNGQLRKVQVRQPTVIKDYNLYMGRVDKSDHQ